MICKKCNSTDIIKNGKKEVVRIINTHRYTNYKTKHKVQKYKCKKCGYEFIQKEKIKRVTHDDRVEIEFLYKNNYSIRDISIKLNFSETTIRNNIRKINEPKLSLVEQVIKDW